MPAKSFSPWLMEAILGLLLQSDSYRDDFFPILKPENFRQEDKVLQTWAEIIWDYHRVYKVFPSIDTLVEEVSTDCKNLDVFPTKPSDDQINALLDFLKDHLLNEELLSQEQYVRDNTIKIVRFNAVLRAVKENSVGLRNGELDIEKFSQTIYESTALATPMPLGVNLAETLEARTQERLTSSMPQGIVSVNIPFFKQCMTYGGLPKGSLGFFLGATNGGKSMALIQMAKEAALVDGYNVLHVTCELSEEEVVNRLDSSITGVKLKDLREQANIVKKAYLASPRSMAVASRIRVSELGMGKNTVDDIRAIIDKLDRKGFMPKVVVVDYADHLTSKKKTNEYRHSLTEIWTDLVQLSKEIAGVVWTASQTNDAGTKASESEESKMGKTHMDESRMKIKLASLGIGIARSPSEINKGEARMIMLKNRHGYGDGTTIKFYPDFHRARFMGSVDKIHKLGVMTEAEAYSEMNIEPDESVAPNSVSRKTMLASDDDE